MSNQPPEQPQLPPSITAKHELTRLLSELIPDVTTGIVDDFHSVIDRFEAASPRPAEGGQAQEIGEPLPFADEVAALLNECAYAITGLAEQQAKHDDFYESTLAKIEPMLKRLAATSSTPRPERCENHCGHEAEFINEEGICTWGFNIDQMCGHQCTFSRVEQPQNEAISQAAEKIEVLTSQSQFERLLPDDRYDAIVAIIESELKGE